MNVRRFLFPCCLMLFCALQSARLSAALLPNEIRTGSATSADQNAIKQFISDKIGKLSSTEPMAQSAARDALLGEVQPPPPNQPPLSQPFLDTFAGDLNNELLPLAKNPDARIRLNVAIIAARIAERANDNKLEPLVMQLLNDQNEAVVLWAIKASGPMLPSILGNNVQRAQDKLIATMLNAVKAHPQNGPIIQVASQALRIDISGGNSLPANWNSVASALVDANLQLLDLRIGQYREGLPVFPSAELANTTFLVVPQVWKNSGVTPAQHKEIAQVLVNLMSVAAGRFGDAPQAERADIAALVKNVVDAIWVIGDYSGNDALKTAADTKKRSINQSISPADLATRVQEVRTALIAIADYKDLKSSPTVNPMPTTQPAASQP